MRLPETAVRQTVNQAFKHSETHELSSISHCLCESGQFTVLSDRVNVV